MSKLTVLVGLPASGKTTYINQFMKNHIGTVRLSLDDFRVLISGHEFFGPFEPTAHAWIDHTGRYLLSQEYDVVLDATHVRRNLREKWVRIAKECGARTLCIHFDVPFETCCERNEARGRTVPVEVMERMRDQFEVPSEEEGFDEVIHAEWKGGEQPAFKKEEP